MLKKLTFTLIAVLSLFTFSNAQDSFSESSVSPNEPVTAFLKARELMDQRKLKDAGLIMKELHKKYPNDYKIQYWYLSLIRFVETPKQSVKTLDNRLARLRATPIENRTEDFYSIYFLALMVSDKPDELSKATEEFRGKYPKSLQYSAYIYEVIKKQTDPVKTVKMLDNFIEKFENEDNLVATAARKRVVIISQNPTSFEDETLLRAAEKLDELMYRRAENPDWKATQKKGYAYYPWGTRAITDGLQETYPKKSLEYAKKGLEYAVANKKNEPFMSFYIPILKQSMLISYAKLKDSKNAAKTGEELLEILENPLLETEINEPKIRNIYAYAAVKEGLITQARKQFIIASIINPRLKKDLADFNILHPMPKTEYTSFEKEIKDEYSKTQLIRDRKQKESLLKKQISAKASDFLVKDLNGKEVSLNDYKGKVLFLGFWATWCAPCIEEMKEVQIAYKKYANNPNVAFAYICTDGREGSSRMARIIEENDYEFSNFYGNDDVQKSYNAYTYPRLFVIDPSGNIRFKHEGFVNDGYFAKRVDWMIEELTK